MNAPINLIATTELVRQWRFITKKKKPKSPEILNELRKRRVIR